MRNLDIKMVINTKCELLVAPKSELGDEGFVYLEFLVSDCVDTLSTLTISENPKIFRYFFEKDGLYMYYRLKIPTKKLLDDMSASYENRLYYDSDSGKLLIGEILIETSEQLENIVDDDLPKAKYRITEMIEEPVFSICRIATCLENLQRKYIFEGRSIGNKCNNDSDKLNRDFLFSSIFILRILIKQQRYEEALKILESINRCSELCNTITFNNSCGCK